jgi:hypothetical protein
MHRTKVNTWKKIFCWRVMWQFGIIIWFSPNASGSTRETVQSEWNPQEWSCSQGSIPCHCSEQAEGEH